VAQLTSVNTRATRLGNNINYATSVNLHGLGNDATLILLNGRRMGSSGISGNFTDISSIPAIAVQRVEIELDGASAIYGSDAVGGVVNVILRKDFEGGEFRIRGGGSTDGGADEGQVGLVLGHNWSTGGALFAYEGTSRGRLSASDRDYTASADLRPFGGSDFRLTTAFPGNVVGINPATGLSGPFFGIPPGQNGLGLTPASFLPGVINRSSPQQGVDILPDQRIQSLYAAFHQSLGDRLEVSGDAHYGYRIAEANIAASISTLTVTRANPFFVSPNGAASNQIQYDFIGELPSPTTRGSSASLSTSLGADLRLDHDWAANGYLAFAQQVDASDTAGLVNSAILSEALGNTPDQAATAYSPARDGFFNPYTGLAANPPAVTRAIGSGFSHTRGVSRVVTADLQFDGPVFSLPGGPVKLAVGGNIRRETFERTGANFLSTVTATPQEEIDGARTVGALFAELRAPLVGEANALPGVQSLELSAAVRYEHYSDFGRTENPKVGLTWKPLSDVTVRGAYGRSFRAPNFDDLKSPALDAALNFPVGTTRVLSLALEGGNPNLKPETATSWTVGADYAPHWAPGLTVSASWFDIDFQNRIDRPVLQNLANALTDPRFVDFVKRIQPDSNPADLALINSLLSAPAASGVIGLNPAANYRAIVDIRAVNTGELDVEGLDLQAAYRFDALGGRFNLAGNASRLFRYDQALTPTASAQSLLGQVTYPAKLRARASGDFTRGAWSLGAAVNYLSAFHDTLGQRIDDQTTLDVQGRLDRPEGRFGNSTLTLIVRNVFDTAPPFYNNPFGFAFDPGNADPIGRFVAVQLSKRW
jgi:iron complex outermembrane receptor protein